MQLADSDHALLTPTRCRLHARVWPHEDMKVRAAFVMLCLSRVATAGEVTLDRTCVAIDDADTLAPPDRARATELLTRVLERADLFVVASDCSETYALSHERAGDGYVIRMRSSAGKRRMAVPALDELSAKYARMVRSLIEAKAVTQESPSIEPQVAAAEIHEPVEPLPTANIEETAPVAPSRKRNLWYAMVGPQLSGGAGVSLGFRHAFSSVSLDLAYNVRGSDGGTELSAFSAELLRTTQLSPSVRGYVGGGLSAGAMDRGEYWGEGVHAELTTGLQVGGARGTQFLTQFDLTLPFYRLGDRQGQHDYVPTAMISAGLGF